MFSLYAWLDSLKSLTPMRQARSPSLGSLLLTVSFRMLTMFSATDLLFIMPRTSGKAIFRITMLYRSTPNRHQFIFPLSCVFSYLPRVMSYITSWILSCLFILCSQVLHVFLYLFGTLCLFHSFFPTFMSFAYCLPRSFMFFLSFWQPMSFHSFFLISMSLLIVLPTLTFFVHILPTHLFIILKTLSYYSTDSCFFIL